MIYMREYHTKIDYDGERDTEGRYPLIEKTFVDSSPKSKTMTYTWETVKEFHNARCARSHDYIGWLFGGVLCKLTSYHGITSFQLFLGRDKFPDTIEASWLKSHIEAVSNAWHKKEITAMLPGSYDESNKWVGHPDYIAAVQELKVLRSMTEENLEKACETA